MHPVACKQKVVVFIGVQLPIRCSANVSFTRIRMKCWGCPY